ncbi:MAG: hypothetical protein M0P31_07015 [Solirubrobacteraceae bacterium]|nr:hypothetical protein [Solirubrobacteraceae bacterium]
MCVQCAAGAMAAVAGAGGARIWLQARLPWLARPAARRWATRTSVVVAVLAAGVLGPSAHAEAPATHGAAPSHVEPTARAVAPPDR